MLTNNWEKDSFLYHWPESQRLRTALDSRKSAICYTMPGIKLDERLPCKEQDKYEAFFKEHFSIVSPELNAKGLAHLLKNNKAEIALHAATVLLSQMGQGVNKIGRTSITNEQTLTLWTIRFQLLMLLKMNSQAIEEMAAFEDLDAPDLYYQFYPTSNRKGTMVPFALRLIHAEILRFTPFPWKSLERIEKLKANVQWVIHDLESVNNENVSAWKIRLLAVEKIQGRLLFSLGETRLTMEHLENLQKVVDQNQQEKICNEMMRVALTVGDDAAASKKLQEAASLGPQSNDLTFHKALRAIFLGAYPHAVDYGQRLNRADDQRYLVPNLSAISCLYTGKVNDGVQILSKCNMPLPEHLMTNIRSMSELGLPAAQKDTLMKEIEEKQF